MQTLLAGDCIAGMKTLPDGCVHTCITSPPYFGLRDYGHEDQIGLEETPEQFVSRLVEVFREVRRVLRDDGTLWLNLGDSYSGAAAGKRTGGNLAEWKNGGRRNPDVGETGHKKPGQSKQLLGIPWRVAFALQADGWYLRQDIIWSKPNPMPESVKDRCTKAHEYIFLFSKSPRYFFDHEAIKEDAVGQASGNLARKSRPSQSSLGRGDQKGSVPWEGGSLRSRRSVWTVTTKPFKGAHFATFPPDLIEPCVMAGAPERCCSACGAPQERVVEKTTSFWGGSGRAGRTAEDVNASGKWAGQQYGKNLKLGPLVTSETVGWRPTCVCDAGAPVGGTVLDPFFGAGTTGLVAQMNNRSWIGCELNPKYVEMARGRLGMPPSFARELEGLLG
ncbi:DNA methylase [Gemmobacter caeni]|uniref:Methyltransferase n=1 Tax=Gemmobacter caeni TaxID=589035 RepID=A0A2T6AZ79_9RHOB|nr:site-specific DNA-methyltransferase [Gemmobacter caeni]PTX49122.1 DNA methylase [Gemmobacter caeni]TWI93459.1 DNA methylase [Gemmobacter caeni]